MPPKMDLSGTDTQPLNSTKLCDARLRLFLAKTITYFTETGYDVIRPIVSPYSVLFCLSPLAGKSRKDSSVSCPSDDVPLCRSARTSYQPEAQARRSTSPSSLALRVGVDSVCGPRNRRDLHGPRQSAKTAVPPKPHSIPLMREPPWRNWLISTVPAASAAT